MHTATRTITLRHTDAAGVLYFANQLELAHEVFEEWLASRGLPLRSILDGADWVLPIVHASADYGAPLRLGDVVSLTVRVTKVGDRSLTWEATLERSGARAGRVEVTHVAVDRATGKARPLPVEVAALAAAPA